MLQNSGSQKRRNNQQIAIAILDADAKDIDETAQLMTNEQKPNNLTNDNDKKTTKQKTFCQWLMTKPLDKFPFICFVSYFLITIALAIFHFMDADTAFILSGSLGILVSSYGLKHFYTLMNLKKEVDKYSQLNVKLTQENAHLSYEVDRFELANDRLKDTEVRISQANERNQVNLEQFKSLEKNMGSFATSAFAGIEKFRDHAHVLSQKWRNETYTHESTLLHQVFDRIQTKNDVQNKRKKMGKKDDSEVLTRADFDDFAEQIPDSYRKRFKRLGTFRTLAGDKSVISYDNFKCALDVFATMQTDNVDFDIEFEDDIPETEIQFAKSSDEDGVFSGSDFKTDDGDGVFSGSDMSAGMKSSVKSHKKVTIKKKNKKGEIEKEFHYNVFASMMFSDVDVDDDDNDSFLHGNPHALFSDVDVDDDGNDIGLLFVKNKNMLGTLREEDFENMKLDKIENQIRKKSYMQLPSFIKNKSSKSKPKLRSVVESQFGDMLGGASSVVYTTDEDY